MSRSIIAAGTVVSGGRVLRPGWLEVGDRTVLAVGTGAPPRPADTTLHDGTVVPGFVDMHVHGGGGSAFPNGSTEQSRTAIALHRRHGTTTMMASLVAAQPDPLLDQVRMLADLVAEGEIAGIHLEGPWLAPTRCGAHDRAALREPTPAELRDLIAAGRDGIRMITIAPELRGAPAVIRYAVDAGIVVAVGHTEASYEQTRDAIAAGATVGTHLFNAMRPLRHRDPGPVVALLEDPGVIAELVLDGRHVHPAVYRHALAAGGPDRIALVTDAMAAAGMPDGSYRLGKVPVTVANGLARVTGTSTIAGSTATTDRLFRNAVHFGMVPTADDRLGEDRDLAPGDEGSGPVDGEALLRAVAQTSGAPARALGLPVGALSVGDAADLVLLDAGLRAAAVMRGGVWVTSAAGVRAASHTG